MASRPRSVKKRGWPDGLYERGGYFSWRNPVTGKEMGIGRVTERDAKAQASEANIAVQDLLGKPRLVDRLLGNEDQSLRAWLKTYEDEKLPKRALADSTLKQYRSLLKMARRLLKDVLDLPLPKVKTRAYADAIDAAAEDTPTMAKSMRALLIDCLDSAMAAGWTEANPVRLTDVPGVTVKRARLTWPVFQQLYAKMPAGRIKNAVALALVSGQARETVAAGQFAQLAMVEQPGLEPVECWKVTRGKTGAMIAIPLDLHLNAFGMSLRDVVKQCRASKVVSPFMVHNTTRAEGRLGQPVPLDAISDGFRAAVQALEMDWGGKTPPTFHELRSLSKRLYKAQGGVNTIDLLGHGSEEMGALYEDGRGAEYKLVSLK